MEAKEASYGVVWARGRVEEGFRGGLGDGGANGCGGGSGRHGGARPGAQSREERGGDVGGVLAMQMGGRRAEQG